MFAREAPKRIADQTGRFYQLGALLGEGGQGAVYQVEGGRLAAKLYFDASAVRRERLRAQLAHVRRLPLEDVPIARPLELLRPPVVGYLMEQLTGMASLGRLASPPREAELAGWYLETGGLRRRLRLLAHAAEALAQLHGKALVYGDPSPANVFTSADPASVEVRLIDADNLHYESSPSTAPVYTPGYGAPELVAGRAGATSLTDAHAFATLAFEVLALVHPLVGDTVLEGEPELEERAWAGELPWIEDPQDASNRCTHGIPRELVLSPRLRALFERTFGPGLRTPAERPGLSEWAEGLHRAGDHVITCPQCRGGYYRNAPRCPFCEAPRPPLLLVRVARWERLAREDGQGSFHPVEGVGHLPSLAVGPGEPLELPARIGQPGSRPGQRARLAELTFEAGRRGAERVRLRALEGAGLLVSLRDGSEPRALTGRAVTIPLPEDRSRQWVLHFGPLDQPHRIALFEAVSPERA